MRRDNSKGFTLLEMAVYLIVGGLIMVAVVQLVPVLKGSLEQELQDITLESLNEAVIGFALVHSRLPCPDTDGDGFEECTGSTGAFPYRTLGITRFPRESAGVLFRYGVYRNENAADDSLDADLAVLKNRYEPMLPPGEGPLNNLNGHDFCLALRNAALFGVDTNFLTAGTPVVNVAFVVADSGSGDADLDGDLFDNGNGAGFGFTTPNVPQSSAYDDQVAATGFQQLAGRLQCTAEMAEVNSAARTAMVTYDQRRAAQLFKEFRDFEVMVRENNLESAEVNRDYAIVTDVLAVATGVTGVAIAAETAGGATGATVAAGVAIAASTALLIDAALKVQEAQDALDVALTHQTNAENALTEAEANEAAALTTVQNADARRLLQ